MIESHDVRYTQETAVQANGIKIIYDAFGHPDDPPLVLIMGLGMPMIAWDERFCEQLAARGYWVIRFDNRDSGRSTIFKDAHRPGIFAMMLATTFGTTLNAAYRLDDMADDAVGLLDALAIDGAHLVGASMGGMIAQTVAINHPERVQTLTSIMSSPGDPRLPQAKPKILFMLLRRPPKEKEAYLEQAVKVARMLSGGRFPVDEERTRRRAGRMWERGLHPGGTARQMAAVMTSGSRADALRAVETPALVIHGVADPLLPVQHGLETAKILPNADLLIIDGMGHNLPVEVWPRVIETIDQHVSDHG